MNRPIWTQRLMELYAESGSSIRDISEATNIPKSALQRYFTGETINIPTDRIQRLAQYFGVEAVYIMGWSDAPDGILDGGFQGLPKGVLMKDGTIVPVPDGKEKQVETFVLLFNALDEEKQRFIIQSMRGLKAEE